MNKKTFKILCIDGGGIKGLYSASVLARIEEKTGKKSGDYFDMICGTSTGGLIALGIAAGMTADQLVQLYKNEGARIFPTLENKIGKWVQRNIYHVIRQTFFYGKFSNDSLKSILEETFKSKTLGELDNLVCIPSFNLTKGMPRVFKYPHIEGDFFMDKDISLVDAALATSAAPTYFPIHEYKDTLYVDGGVWANNPALCGLLEALDYFVGENKEYDHIEMLSISSISQPSGWSSKSRKKRSFIGWKSKLIQTSMDGQAYFTDFFLEKTLHKIQAKSKYVRVKSPELSQEQMKILEMDRADLASIKTLISLGNHDGYKYATQNEVLDFFKYPKTYKTTQNG